MDEAQVATPQQSGPPVAIDAPAEVVGASCYLCGDEPDTAPFVLADKVIRVPTDQGDLNAHALCFYVVRSKQLEGMLAGAQKAADDTAAAMRAQHQTLCAVLGKTGTVRLHQHNFELAMKANWQLDIRTAPDGSTSLKLKGAGDVELVSTMPPKNGATR